MSSKKKATTPCKFNLAIDCDGNDCDRGLLDWLKQEAEE